MKLSDDVINKIKEAAEKIAYGSVTIYLVDSLNSIDIEINERIRFEKATAPRAGEACLPRRKVIRMDNL